MSMSLIFSLPQLITSTGHRIAAGLQTSSLHSQDCTVLSLGYLSVSWGRAWWYRHVCFHLWYKGFIKWVTDRLKRNRSMQSLGAAQLSVVAFEDTREILLLSENKMRNCTLLFTTSMGSFFITRCLYQVGFHQEIYQGEREGIWTVKISKINMKLNPLSRAQTLNPWTLGGFPHKSNGLSKTVHPTISLYFIQSRSGFWIDRKMGSFPTCNTDNFRFW